MEEEDGWVGSEEIDFDIPDLPSHLNPRKVNWYNSKMKTWKSLSKLHAYGEGNRVISINNLFDMQHMTACDTSLNYQITQRFIAGTTGDILAEKVSIAISKRVPFTAITASVKAGLGPDARAVSVLESRTDHREMIISGDHKGSPVLIFLSAEEHKEVYNLKLDIISSPEASIALKQQIDVSFENEKMGTIKWWFTGRHGVDSKDIYLPPLKTVIHSEFYPDLGDPKQYVADYMASEEAILLMAGPPGTGKTTMLRHLISDHKLTAHVIYDEALMQKDSIFQDFLFDGDSDLMIIEDADTILSARESDGNKLMSRFLNVSDGLIKLPNKKLVFTTNITDFGKVDQALLRPGRCFGVMHTRPLNLTEAQAAAQVAGLPIPIEKREYTIAELFNQGKRQQVRTIGFGARH